MTAKPPTEIDMPHALDRFIERYMPSETFRGHAEAVMRRLMGGAVYVGPEDGTDQHFWDVHVDLTRFVTDAKGQRAICYGRMRLVVLSSGLVKTVLPLDSQEPPERRGRR